METGSQVLRSYHPLFEFTLAEIFFEYLFSFWVTQFQIKLFKLN